MSDAPTPKPSQHHRELARLEGVWRGVESTRGDREKLPVGTYERGCSVRHTECAYYFKRRAGVPVLHEGFESVVIVGDTVAACIPVHQIP